MIQVDQPINHSDNFNTSQCPLLEVQDLKKSFFIHERNKKIDAFSHLSFSIQKGELLAMTGPSGLGKSTVLKCIYRSYLSDSGSILYNTEKFTLDLLQCSDHQMVWLRQKEMGYVTQFLHCLPRKSALSIVSEPLLKLGFTIGEAEAEAAKMLKRFNLPEHLWEISPHTFSGGEKQRVNLARGFISKPRLLLLDEPTASLDPVTSNIVIENIQELQREGTTILGVFHDLQLVKKIANREIKLRKIEEL